jgi:hypothetical protein
VPGRPRWRPGTGLTGGVDMSLINVWDDAEGGTSGDEDEVRVRNVHKKDGSCKQFETDNEELAAVRHILDVLDKMDNGQVMVITKDVW